VQFQRESAYLISERIGNRWSNIKARCMFFPVSKISKSKRKIGMAGENDILGKETAGARS
jgi:hypothetical protein